MKNNEKHSIFEGFHDFASDAPRSPGRPSKDPLGKPKGAPRRALDAPGAAQDAPRRFQERPKNPQERPKSRQERPRTTPGGPRSDQEAPRGPRALPRTLPEASRGAILTSTRTPRSSLSSRFLASSAKLARAPPHDRTRCSKSLVRRSFRDREGHIHCTPWLDGRFGGASPTGDPASEPSGSAEAVTAGTRG